MKGNQGNQVNHLDDLDREIIYRLQYDGRKPLSHIADELGLSEGAVRRRVKRLTDEGVLQIVAIIEPQFLGLNATAMIGIAVEPGRVDEVASRIAGFEEVCYLFMAAGEFDLFAEVYCKDMKHFADFLNRKLQKVTGVRRTQTYMNLKMYKLSYRWGNSGPAKKYTGG